MHSLPEHAWLFNLADGQAHQWPVPLTPDAEGIVTAVCDAETMPFRLVEEGLAGRCVCRLTIAIMATENETRCHGCDRRWAREEWPERRILFDGIRCFTCLLRAGDSYVDVLAARLPTTAEFRDAVRGMRVDSPADDPADGS